MVLSGARKVEAEKPPLTSHHSLFGAGGFPPRAENAVLQKGTVRL